MTAPAPADTAPAPAAPAPGKDAGVPDVVRRRLATLDPGLHAYSWLVTGVVAAIAAVLRLTGIGRPRGYVFDEIYYPTDAWDMLSRGVEWETERDTAAYVVHPPLGKWLIGLGELAFGNNALGWRVPAAVAGVLMIVILIRVTYRLFRSIVLAGVAGLLMTFDGFHFVLSRISLLDMFLSVFVLATFAAMVLDRDHYRRRLLRALEDGYDPATAPRSPRIVPWWLLVAGLLLGLACGVKWSALFFLPAFAALIVGWRMQARRSAGLRRPFVTGLPGDLGWGLLSFTLAGLGYLATWTGWLGTDNGYLRHHREATGLGEPPVLGALLNLWHYHTEAYGFHSGLTQHHDYQSWPWQWLLLGRPVSFYWPVDPPGDCGAAECVREILLLGTPVLWWSFLPALAALAWFGIARRDWRAYAIGAGVASGLLPWFYYAVADGRTMFSFYVLPALPFLILAVVYVLGALVTPPGGMPPAAARTDRRLVGSLAIGIYVALVAACFAWFHPIFVGDLIPYDSWLQRMWLGNRWI